MKVWINNPFDLLPGEGGRLQRFALLTQALARAGHDVLWFSSNWCHLRKCRRKAPETETLRRILELKEGEGRVEIRLIDTPSYTRNISFRRIWSHRRYAMAWPETAGEERPDLIVVSMPPMGTARVAQRWKVPVVIDLQDLWPETFYQALPGFLRSWGPQLFAPMRRSMMRQYRKAAGIALVTDGYRERTGRDDCRTFPLGVPLSAWREKEIGRCITICYVGNLGCSYRISVCLEALRKLKAEGLPVLLEVAGEGPLRTQIQEGIRAGLPIRFHGVLKGNELNLLLDRSEIGVVPMQAAMGVGIPNKIFDYAAHGVAIVNGLRGESERLVEAYGAGVNYEVDSVDSLVNALRRLIVNRTLLAASCRASRRLAEERFDAARIYPGYAAWLTGLADRADRGK